MSRLVTGGAGRTASVLAALVAFLAEGVAIAASPAGSARWNEAAVALVVLAYALVGLVIVWHRPGHPIGRLALAIAGVWGVGEALVATSYAVLVEHPGVRSAALGSAVGTFLRGLPWFAAVMWLPLRFPDGAPASTRLGRFGERFTIATVTVFSAVSLFSPTLTDLRVDHVDNPIGVPAGLAPAMGVLAGIALLMGIVAVGLAVATLVQKYRRGGPLTRQQTLVFGAAFVPPLAALVASFADAADPWLFAVATIPLPIAIGVAVLQRRLYDIQLAVNRSITYGTLWLAIAALYAIVVGGVGVMLRRPGAAWLPWMAAAVVAVSFAPLRDALQRGANKVTYGQWSQPADVLAATARRLGDAGDVPSLLHSLVEDVGQVLDLSYMEITDPRGRSLARRGDRPGDVDRLTMTSYGVDVGTLSWARRPLRETDRALLEDLARQLGTVVHAAGLLEAVRASQERLVLAREEERRRLRRDLHDGLGPALAGLTLRVDTLRNLVRLRPDDTGTSGLADHGLLDLRTGIQAAVLDVRRIVEGLRPPALDELGLADAIAQLADRVTAGSDLTVDVRAEPLPRLPAAAEVAAYRIVQEALTNIVRHADARSACVALGRGSAGLTLRIRDDGHGLVAPRPDGVGLTSMRERAEEIGGSLVIDPSPGEGTTITAVLPIVVATAPEVTA
ncbi:MAG TPA: sensor histidine kinase [Kineosporiaceae bacterium]|nr:sensor histidine kinase [Kineosporiaceae bacterium]